MDNPVMSRPLLNWVIPEKLDVDDRDPIFTFQLSGQEYCLQNLSIVFWIETLAVVGFMALLAAGVSIIVYKLIIQRQGTVMSSLIGFGFIIPFWVTFPYYGIALFGLRNKLMKFCFGVISPTLGIFHTTEAIYGTAPKHVTASLSAYALYYGSPMALKYDAKHSKHITASIRDMLYHLQWFIIYLVLMGTVQSYAALSHYQPFGSFDEPWYSASRFLHPIQLGNNLVLAVLMQLYLTSCCEGLITATVILTGRKCEPVMANPMFKCTSPTDFWARRWNRLVSSVLKRGVYVPLRKHGVPRALAAMGAFLSSGIFHEWLLTVVFEPHTSELGPNGECELPLCYNPPLGGATSFMLYNAAIIMVEYTVRESKVVAQIASHLPNPCRTVLLVLIGLPVAHWFVEPYVVSNFFDHSGIGMPLIRPM